jgi:hypothetical protein
MSAGATSGYHNLKSEGARNRRDTLGLRAMIEPEGSQWLMTKSSGDARVASRAPMHRH